jgi:hypothetical protein
LSCVDRSAHQSLKAFAKLTHFTGIFLPNWCHQVAPHDLLLVATWIAVVMVLLIFMAAFQSVQLAIEFRNSDSIHSIVSHFPFISADGDHSIALSLPVTNFLVLFQRLERLGTAIIRRVLQL